MRARRGWAWPLVPLYAAAVWVKERLRAAGLLRVKTLRWPVVSVGSLSAGGAGKTPVVIALAVMLKERGWVVDVLSRGYGRSSCEVEKVLVDAVDAGKRFGDEPVLMARRAGAEVWVGGDRFAAGVRAEGKSALTLSAPSLSAEFAEEKHAHLLDDGFQHRRLGRTVDVVLVTAEDLEDALLPAGNLREPTGALARADVVVIREDELEAVGERVRKMIRKDAQMWTVRRTLRFPGPLFVFGAGMRPVAFCAIARPDGFETMLRAAGCAVVDTIVFDDHHAYETADMDRAVELASELKATGFVTTEKDAVKLTEAMRAKLETVGPVMVAALDAEFVFPERVARELEALVEQGTGIRD